MAVKNRVWDTELTGSVIWRTQKPDSTGIEYPGPGTFGVHTSDYTVIRDTRNPSVIAKNISENDESPDGFWVLDGNLLDSSGNGRDLSVTGTEIYGNGPFEGTQAFFFNGSTLLSYTTDSAFYATGSITLETFIRPIRNLVADRTWYICFATSGESLATNVIYSLYTEADSTISIIHERSAGVDELLVSDYHVVDNEWTHIAMTRDSVSGLNTFYLNGNVILSGTLNNPEDGSSGNLAIGAFPTGLQYFKGLMSNVKIYKDKVLTAETIKRHATQLLPDWRSE